VTGDGIPRGTIDTITFTIGLVPGENSVNVENISIVYADAIRTESLIPVEGFYGDPPQGSWEFWKCRTKWAAPTTGSNSRSGLSSVSIPKPRSFPGSLSQSSLNLLPAHP